jgi:type VI secretion system protein ImpF
MMNTIALGSSVDLSRHDRVRKSIVNYGLPDIVHRSIDEARVNDIADEIRTALMQFEPRLLPGSIEVKRDDSIARATLKVRFLVRAVLHNEPTNIPIEFVTDVELDTGKVIAERV